MSSEIERSFRLSSAFSQTVDEIAAVAVEQFRAEPPELVFDAALLAGVAHHPVLALELGGDGAELLEEEVVEAGIAVEAGYLQLREVGAVARLEHQRGVGAGLRGDVEVASGRPHRPTT